MDFNVNVKITLEETPALIECFSTFVDCLHKVVATPVVSAAQMVELDCPPLKPETVAFIQAQAEAQAEPVEAQAEQEPLKAEHKYTVAEIQAACQPLCVAGRLDEIAQVLKSFGAETLFELMEKEELYDPFINALKGLGVEL